MNNPLLHALVRVAVLDDDAVILKLIERLVQREPGMTIVGAFNCLPDALTHVLDLKTQVLIVDFDMPGHDHLALLRDRLPGVRLLAVTLLDVNCYRNLGLGTGADALISKSTLSLELGPALQSLRQTLPP